MQRTLANKSLIYKAARPFSTQNTLIASLNPERNNSLRVMSTPTWPVPYYQRAFRHPANLDKPAGDLMHIGNSLHAYHAVIAKEMLKLQGNGYVVEAIE